MPRHRSLRLCQATIMRRMETPTNQQDATKSHGAMWHPTPRPEGRRSVDISLDATGTFVLDAAGSILQAVSSQFLLMLPRRLRCHRLNSCSHKAFHCLTSAEFQRLPPIKQKSESHIYRIPYPTQSVECGACTPAAVSVLPKNRRIPILPARTCVPRAPRNCGGSRSARRLICVGDSLWLWQRL